MSRVQNLRQRGNLNLSIMAQGKTLHQLLIKMGVNKFKDHSALYPFNCLSVRVLCIVTAQGSARCRTIHTVKIAVAFG